MNALLPDVAIRQPTPAEVRICRMLLPDVMRVGYNLQWFVATVGTPTRVVAAAVLGQDRTISPPGWQLNIHVIPPYRRKGIGATLLHYVCSHAAALGITTIDSWPPLCEGTGETEFLTASGFALARRAFEYEGQLSDIIAGLEAICRRLRAHGRIPDTAEVIPLAAADHWAVMEMHAQYLGGTPEWLLPRLTGAVPDQFDPHFSRVLLVERRLAAFSLARIHPDGVTAEIPARVARPDVRGRWVMCHLLHQQVLTSVGTPLQRLRYFALDDNHDTQRLGHHIGTHLARVIVRYRRPTA